MKKHFYHLSFLLGLGLFSFSASAQMGPNPPKNWQNQSIEKDSVYGTGSDEALEFLKGRKSTTVIVAVIDGGVYTKHPALAGQIWVNQKEVAGNKKDDDKNGYIDDVNGWDFIGGKDSDINHENLEVTRLYRDYSKKYANVTSDAKLSKSDKKEYAQWLKVKADYETNHAMFQKQYDGLKNFVDSVGLLKGVMGKSDITQDDLNKYVPTDTGFAKVKRRLNRNFARFSAFMPGMTSDSLIKLVLNRGLDQLGGFVKYNYNLNFNPRYLVGDDYTNAKEHNYGNNDVIGPTDVHGTHVSGIIAGIRNGSHGQEGEADNVKILVVRVVPDGDERDKDVANGIRYAVDNGAKVINMSFGKPYSYNKKVVDDAVKYAEKHDVLLVHAAGNDAKDTDPDSASNFPTRRFENSTKDASNWLEVGASDVHGKPGSFSNYGKISVDLFAPGVKVYSSVPDTGYAYFNGTSMASPSAAGVACIIREYFPKLSAKEVREILMQSVTPITAKVPMPGHPDRMVSYTDLCITGGTINAYKAVQLAIKKTGGK